MITFARQPLVDSAAVLEGLRNPKKPGGIPNNTLPLAIAAAWAYADPATFASVMARRGLLDPDAPPAQARYIEVVNDAMFVCAKSYLVLNGDVAILSFRGTEPTNVINWLADATVSPVPFHSGHGYVHDGFYRNLRAIWPSVAVALADARPDHLYITGHSFGGALAVLAAALLADYAADDKHARDFGPYWGRLRGVFTFGQPAVGDKAFNQKYEALFGDKLFRFIYGNDIVPHLPPRNKQHPLEHFGQVFHAKQGEPWQLALAPTPAVKSTIESNVVGALAWAQKQLGIAPRLVLPLSWDDHAPQNYVRTSLPNGAESGSEFD